MVNCYFSTPEKKITFQHAVSKTLPRLLFLTDSLSQSATARPPVVRKGAELRSFMSTSVLLFRLGGPLGPANGAPISKSWSIFDTSSTLPFVDKSRLVISAVFIFIMHLHGNVIWPVRIVFFCRLQIFQKGGIVVSAPIHEKRHLIWHS